MQAFGDFGVPGVRGGGGASGDLGGAHVRTRIPAQAGEPADRLGEEAAVGPGDPDVPVVQLGLQRHGEADAQAGQEVAVRVAVPDKGMHHPHAAGVGVEK